MGFVTIDIAEAAQFKQGGVIPVTLQWNNIQIKETALLQEYSNFTAELLCEATSTSYHECYKDALEAIRDVKRAHFYNQVYICFQ